MAIRLIVINDQNTTLSGAAPLAQRTIPSGAVVRLQEVFGSAGAALDYMLGAARERVVETVVALARGAAQQQVEDAGGDARAGVATDWPDP